MTAAPQRRERSGSSRSDRRASRTRYRSEESALCRVARGQGQRDHIFGARRPRAGSRRLQPPAGALPARRSRLLEVVAGSNDRDRYEPESDSYRGRHSGTHRVEQPVWGSDRRYDAPNRAASGKSLRYHEHRKPN